MGLFEGKTSTERNKIIAAGVLGLVSLVALYMAFGRSFFGGSSTTATVKVTATPKPGATPGAVKPPSGLPTADEQDFLFQTTPVVYRPGTYGAPAPGRNIFAFYEPPPPGTPLPPPVPTPTPPPPPSPSPTPVFYAAGVSPQSVYAGSRGFKMEVGGDRFTPDARIYFNQTEMPTTFVSPQRLSTTIPDNLIAQEGPRQIIVQTPDGKSYSFPVMLTVQAPPKPTTIQYIGMIGRKRYNNDTAYFVDTSKPLPCPGCPPVPFGARLNDTVASRFRLIDISTTEVIVEDISLGFRHRVAITKTPGTPTSGVMPFGPSGGQIPGIPNNIQRYTTPTQRPPVKPGEKKEDVDDNDDPDRE
jgi:hypothetical protein